jgi:hypothetical protein
VVININGYKKWAKKCIKQLTYRHNMMILCQGREDNPLHTDAFIVLIINLKDPIWSKTTLDCERSVTRTLFMEENSDGDRLN